MGDRHRLAVITSKPMQQAGYSELLTARLSGELAGRIDLVERDLLDKIGDEYQLAALLGGGATDQRIALGQLLRADTLLLVFTADGEKSDGQPATRAIRIVIADTRTGARLAVDGLPEVKNPEQTADEVVRRLESTLRRYPRGVEQIVGVSPFLSRCLTHAYDSYQTSCAELLSHALSQRPGIAVLETEEARAIREERALTASRATEKGDGSADRGSAVEGRWVPVLVRGEFLATQQGPAGGDSERFHVDVTIERPGQAAKVIRAADLTHGQLVEFLATTLPGKILGDASSKPAPAGFSAEAQFEWLLAEAARFSRVGMWQRAYGLREAAALLRPRDIDLRFRLIDAYHRQMMHPLAVPRNVADLPSEETIRRQICERTALYPLVLAHLEFMIRNRLARAEELLRRSQALREMPNPTAQRVHFCYDAASIAEAVPSVPAFQDYPLNQRLKAAHRYQRIAKEELQPCYEAQDNFMRSVFPLIQELPSDGKAAVGARLAQIREDFLRHPRFGKSSSARQEAPSPGPKRPDRFASPFGSTRPPGTLDGFGPPTDLLNRGRLQAKPPSSAAAKPAEKWPKWERTGSLRLTIKTLEGRSRAVEDDAWMDLHERWGPAYAWSKQLRHYPIVNWRACTPAMDVLWSDWAVLVMRSEGVAEEILSRPDAGFLDVLWDGRNFWVVSRYVGVWVVSTSGEILRSIGEDQGLPPYDQGEVLYPLSDGRALMAGSFGAGRRGWCAMIDAAGQPPVRVFHQARTVYSGDANLEDDSLGLAFQPTFIHRYRSAGNGPDYCIIGRDIDFGPLLVDCKTLTVSQLPKYAASAGAKHAYNRKRTFFNPGETVCTRHTRDLLFYSEPGRMVIPSACEFLFEPAPRTTLTPPTWQPGVTVWPTPFGSADDAGQPASYCKFRGNQQRILLPVGQWLYAPGDVWHRLHRSSLREERLYERLRPGDPAGRPILRPSSHYGIVYTMPIVNEEYRPFGQIRIHERPESAGD